MCVSFMSSFLALQKELKKLADKKQAQLLQRYFKTGSGEYGEGDIFLGLRSHEIKSVAKNYYDFSLKDIQILLHGDIHEERVCALRILVWQYAKSEERRKSIFNFYLKNAKRVNNWDLVDMSAPNIAGDFLLNKSRKILYKLAKSKNLWERRIAVLATFAFIRQKDFEDILKISKILLNDSHDLIHKATGWMLREVGKRDAKILDDFLKRYYKNMPRTMLRYAIERFSEGKRKWYLKH